MEKIIRIGIIGSSGIAAGHALAYLAMENIQIIAVIANVVTGKAQEFIDLLGIKGAKAFEFHNEMLKEEIDGVSICTPNVAHHRTNIDALHTGKQVLVEKPLAVTLDQRIEVVKVAKETDKMLSVGFQPRYDLNMKTVKQIIQPGQLGDVY